MKYVCSQAKPQRNLVLISSVHGRWIALESQKPKQAVDDSFL